MMRKCRLVLPLMLLLAACQPLKYVPAGEALLDRVTIVSEKGLPATSVIENYLHQEPNDRFLGLLRLNLGWYNLSGADSSRYFNRLFRKLGEPPVIYDEVLTDRSRQAMRRFLMSKGYLNATVDTSVSIVKGKANVTYTIHGRQPYLIRSYSFGEGRDSIRSTIQASLDNTLIKPGNPLDSKVLDEERARVVRLLQRKGHYSINKESFFFRVDSAYGDHTADVRLGLRPWQVIDSIQTGQGQPMDPTSMHPLYAVDRIYFMMDVPMSSYIRLSEQQGGGQNAAPFDVADYDTLQMGPYHIVYRGRPFVDPEVLIDNCRILPGQPYDIQEEERTYSRMNALQLIKYTNIRFRENGRTSGRERGMDAFVVVTPNKKQRFTADIEGTNTAGDLGVAGSLSFSNRNLFHGAEMLQANFRGAYEALSANFSNDYTELGGELSLELPDFRMPFLSADFKRRVDANTEFALSYQNMSRPEFLRTIASASVRYNWSKGMLRQTLDLIDLSYVYMPRVDSTFKARYLTGSSYLRYSYEDHFILRSGYSFSYSSAAPSETKRTYYTVRGSLESAGNVLYAGYSLLKAPKDGDSYTIGNINFAQYLKGEFEYARSVVVNSRNRLAYRAGLGVACPYGNSRILPFEKRFFSGGANSVRGWSVRTLGPGTYQSGSSIDFMNQSGDLKLDLGIEYRSKLFWKLESALFADMGNIWTLRSYAGQPGGQFNATSFYNDLAGSTGLGLRADFSYFLLRLDLGMKVYDPSLVGRDRWRVLSIDSYDDFAVHLAIGYPF